MIFGNLLRYWNQNSNITDYRTPIQAFSMNLQSRGHDNTKKEATMLEAAACIENKSKDKTIHQDTLTSAVKIIFVHWK
jgi:hypothetical protein